jgi:hypothetical protein
MVKGVVRPSALFWMLPVAAWANKTLVLPVALVAAAAGQIRGGTGGGTGMAVLVQADRVGMAVEEAPVRPVMRWVARGTQPVVAAVRTVRTAATVS